MVEQELDTNEVRTRMRAFSSDPNLNCDLWFLTYYIAAGNGSLQPVVDELASMGCRNLEGWEDGFIYAKCPVARDEEKVIANIQSVLRICNRYRAIVDACDVDTAQFPAPSHFEELTRFRGAGDA